MGTEHTLNERELREWITEHDLLIRLSQEQSRLIFQALEKNQTQYRLAAENHVLYLLYQDQEGRHAKEVTIDDVIDLACERNYEKICALQEKCCQIPYQDVDGYSNFLKLLTSHYQSYQELLAAYVQTEHYRKNHKNPEEKQQADDNASYHPKRR